jgi:hypothetical protein
VGCGKREVGRKGGGRKGEGGRKRGGARKRRSKEGRKEVMEERDCGPVKGLCGRFLSKFIDWRFSQTCWYF